MYLPMTSAKGSLAVDKDARGAVMKSGMLGNDGERLFPVDDSVFYAASDSRYVMPVTQGKKSAGGNSNLQSHIIRS
jgi:hypothetical protein